MIQENAEFESLIKNLLAVGTQVRKVNLSKTSFCHLEMEATYNLSQTLLKGLQIIDRKHLTHSKL